jgi:hypothetical protein
MIEKRSAVINPAITNLQVDLALPDVHHPSRYRVKPHLTILKTKKAKAQKKAATRSSGLGILSFFEISKA